MNSAEPQSAAVIASPPLLYLGTLATGCVLQLIWPMPVASTAIWLRLSGLLVFVLAAAFARWSFVSMRHKGTSASLNQGSVALVTNGPFRYSRNPIYVAMTGLYIGIGLLVNSWWLLLLLVPLLLTMQWGVIRREERYLRRQFGDSYQQYLSQVRRWL